MSAQVPLPATNGGVGTPAGYYIINGNSKHSENRATERVTRSYVHQRNIHEQAVEFSNDYMVGGIQHPFISKESTSMTNANVEREMHVSTRLSMESEGDGYRQEHEGYLGETHPNDDDEDVDNLNDYGEYSGDLEDGPVKLFVGQVPKSMDEDALIPIFSQFGPIERVNIIRDRDTSHHRGCAFVTFCHKVDADECESSLHDKYVLPDGKRPVQIRPASGANGTCWIPFRRRHITNLSVESLHFVQSRTTKFSWACSLEI
jgi:hypothetical protein